MQLLFEAVSETQPDAKWQRLFQHFWPAYKAWYINRGGPARTNLREAKKALRRHMPELMPTYEKLLDLSGGDDLAACFLSCYRPPAYLVSCSQAALVTPTEKVLVRNYDLDPKLNEGLILHSHWNERQVIATSEFLWGVADGMNNSGLALSLAFGGSKKVGDGFGIPLILRYVLEVCDTVEEAIEVLNRIPSHMAYNITLLDKRGDAVTVQVAPDQTSKVINVPVATNHQGEVEWAEHARFTATVEREQNLLNHLANSSTSAQSLIDGFGKSPLYNTDYGNGFGTLYTAVYRPDKNRVEWRWPGTVWQQSFADFKEATRPVTYGSAGAQAQMAYAALDSTIAREPKQPSIRLHKLHKKNVAPNERHGRRPSAINYTRPTYYLQEPLANVRASLQAGGCHFSPALNDWFDQAQDSADTAIDWVKLANVWSPPYYDQCFANGKVTV